MKQCLVTGGSGFIGSALVKRLVKEGHYVRVLDSNIRGVESRLNIIADCIDFVEADIRDYNQVQKACRGIGVVHHLAYINGTSTFYKKPQLVLDVAVKGIINVIDACIENNIREFILASSSEVYQNPIAIPTNESIELTVPAKKAANTPFVEESLPTHPSSRSRDPPDSSCTPPESPGTRRTTYTRSTNGSYNSPRFTTRTSAVVTMSTPKGPGNIYSEHRLTRHSQHLNTQKGHTPKNSFPLAEILSFRHHRSRFPWRKSSLSAIIDDLS